MAYIGSQPLPEHLQQLFDHVVTTAEANPELAAALARHFGPSVKRLDRASGGTPRARHRRSPGVFDPFVVMEEGEEALRARLEQLDVEQLKNMVAEHAMDSTKLAMKWKTPERLVELIISTVRGRLAKGAVFRHP